MDSSVVAKVLWEEEDSPVADALFEAFPGRLRAPDLLRFEVANAIRFSRRLTSRAARMEALTTFEGLGIELAPAPPAEVAEALRVAIDTDTTVYDALYLVAARRTGSRLVTADARFAARARGRDVVLLRDWAA